MAGQKEGMQRPSRLQALPHISLFLALGGAIYGVGEVMRVLGGARLYLSDGEVLALLAVGAVSPALLGLAVLPVLLALPPRPLGRQRWLAFLVGALGAGLADLGIWWFSDPPPFQDPSWFQGNPLAFGAVVLAVGFVGLGLYQAVRGARTVAGAALGTTAILGIWSALARSAPAKPTESLPAGAPNVLLVTLDTTRADHMGAYGHTIDTPAFDRVASEGALFLDASAVAAVTGPSHASMLSGSGPWDHGVLLNGIPVPADRTMLAEVLHDHGWATGGFVSSYVLDGDKGFRRGFEVYDDDFGWMPGASELFVPRLWAMVQRHFHPEDDVERRGGDTVDHALAWMNEQPGAWFAWVHLFDAHGPYEPPPPFDTRYYQGDPRDPAHTTMQGVKNVAAYLKKSLEGITDVNYVTAEYDGEISYADAQLERLLGAIEERKLTQDTLVVVIGDHGESLGEHGVWFNHGDDVYEASLHVPFAVRWPGRVSAGTRVEQPFEGTDLAPTVLAILRVAAAPSMTGVSAAGLIGSFEGTGRVEARSLCFDREANVAGRASGAITKPKWRMVGLRGPNSRYVQRETGSGPEYFDLNADPTGEKNIAANVGCTPHGVELLTILDANARALFASQATERSAAEVGEDERKRLEALGYLSGTDGSTSGSSAGSAAGSAATTPDYSQPCPAAVP